MDKGVKTSKRSERKARRLELTRQWALISLERIRDKKDVSAPVLMDCFKNFCISNHIDRQEDKTLRNHIILGAAELLRLIREQAGRKEEEK